MVFPVCLVLFGRQIMFEILELLPYFFLLILINKSSGANDVNVITVDVF